MAPGSTSSSAKAPGPKVANTSKSPPVRPFQDATSSANASTHTTAQLVPAPVAETNGHGNASQTSLPQLSPLKEQQLPGQIYKDGRIRNPVPSKLKGKTSNASGRFAVMHMDIRGKDIAADRDLAAKQTSENTAAAAKKAYESGYQPHRKSNWLRVQEDPQPAASVPFTGTTPYNPALYGLKPAANPPRERPVSHPARPLDPDETKEEQARLLTVLRTLQPIAVVDQLCKALAYFGGTPEAPPPQNGKFPESAEANGSGAVFVGWLAEIFPQLDDNGRRKPRPLRAVSVAVPVAETPPAQSIEKRGRGRPKGSKASKARSDKGIKKGPKKNPANEALEANGYENEDGWVDVDDTIMDEAPVATTGAQTRLTPDHQETGDAEASASAKRRGRPKGSKNRPKDARNGDDQTANPAPISALFSLGKKQLAASRPKATKAKSKETPASNTLMGVANGAVSATAPESQAAPAQAAPAQAVPAQAVPAQAVPAQAAPVQAAPAPAAPAPAAPAQAALAQVASNTDMPQAEAEDTLAAVRAFNESHSSTAEVGPVSNTLVASEPLVAKKSTAKVNGKSQATKKRKRNANGNGAVAQIAAEHVPAVTEAASVTDNQPSLNSALVTSSLDLATPAPPAPKRQKKTKAKAKAATNTAQVANQPVAMPTPQVSQPLVPPPPQATQPTGIQAYTSPTIEELEAQLEQDEQGIPHTEINTASVSRSVPTSQPEPSQRQPHLVQPSQASDLEQGQQPQHVQPNQQRSDQQRGVARQRQQYPQPQQQPVARTVSPIVGQMGTASPHMNVHSASPNINPVHSVSPKVHQQRASKSQTPTPLNSQSQSQQPRSTQPYFAQQSTSAQSSYGQQQNQQYASPQPGKQQFRVSQSQQQQQQSYNTTAQLQQQQHGYTSQQPRYSHQKQSSYSSQAQHPYASPQQQYSSQTRAQQQQQQQQQYATTTTGTAPQTLAAQSPQYGISTSTGYNSNSAAGMNFNSPTYDANQTSNTSRGNNVYSSSTAGSYGNSNQQVSSYATAPRRTLPTTTSNHTQVQNVQSLPQNLNNFSGFEGLGFDSHLISGLDNSTGGHNGLGMSTTSYNMGAGNVSRSSAGTANYSLDSTLRNDGSSYFPQIGHRR